MSLGPLTVLTKALENAFKEAEKLPEAEQDQRAAAIRAEIEGDSAWESRLAGSQEALGALADEALAEKPIRSHAPARSRRGLNSRPTQRFRDAFERLPDRVQRRAALRVLLGHNPLVDIQALAERLGRLLGSAPAQVVAVYLYGSRARAEHRPDSDLDLALLLAAPPLPMLQSVAREVEDLVERAERVPVEAVVLNRAPADLVHRVLRDGVIVLDRDRPARLRFEVRARNEYFDLAPLRRLYRRAPA